MSDKTVEEAIKQLQEQDLMTAKVLAGLTCTMGYNYLLPTLKGEELQAYIEHWLKKLSAVEKEIEGSQKVGEVLNIALKFHYELAQYVRASKVDTADKAMEIAHSFIKKYNSVALPLKAERKNDVWLVDIDVGTVAVKIAKVKVDAKTGDILSYEIPQTTK